jgi:hypothetical protein
VLRRHAAARDLASHAQFRIDPELGYVVYPPGAYPEAAAIAELARPLAGGVDTHRAGLSKKARAGFMIPLLDADALTLDSPLLRLALRQDVLAAVSSYLGLVPVLTHVNVHYSGPGSAVPQLSQLFHCDGDATAQVKIFVHCNDITAAQGPLTLLEARTSRALRQRVGYHFGDRVKDTDKRAADLLDRTNHRPILGAAGTVCFVDTTRCFHFGSRVSPDASPRVLAMVQYLPPASFDLPRDHRAGAPFRHLATPDLTYAQQLVLGAV